MNDKALKKLYALAQGDGYTKSFDEFKQLISTNDKALNTMYDLAQGEGYTKDLSSFKTLMGVEAFDQDLPAVEKTQEKGKGKGKGPAKHRSLTSILFLMVLHPQGKGLHYRVQQKIQLREQQRQE